MTDVAYIPAESVTQERQPAIGYAMALGAGTLFAINGTVSKVMLESGFSSLRLTQIRCTGALIGLALIILATRPQALRTNRRELLYLAAFGVFGVALVQLFYFLAIHRLEIGVSLLIQYLGPLFVALFAFFVLREHVRGRIWIALALALGGLTLVVDLWHGVSLDGLGVLFSLCSAVTFAAYMLLAEHAVGRRDPISLLCFGFLFASIFWAIVQPWWSFPFDVPGKSVSLLGRLSGVHMPLWALMTWMILIGTIIPFFLIVGSMRHITATRAGILAMVEPVVASVVAYAWLGETLSGTTLAGGAVVLCGIVLAQSAR
ncbi:MAG TPA: EamA family transporter [Gaiellaceae bacterium]|nr:EamA family transporter [Gaiellaceae bacterium]